MGHGPLHVADAHEVARPQRARVGDHEAAHDLVHEAARSERHHEAEEDADALERVGLAAGQVRVRHHDRKHPQERRSAAGASAAPSRDRSSAASAVPARSASNQNPISRATNRAMHEDDQHREQPGDGVRDAKTQVLHGRQQEPAHRFAPGPRVGEPSQHEADRGVDHDEIEDDRRAPSRPRARRRAVARRGPRRHRRSRFGRPSARRWRSSLRPTARRARVTPHSASRPNTSTAAAAAPARSSTPGVRASTASSSACRRRSAALGGGAFDGFPGQLVDVRRRQRQHASGCRR